MDNYTNAVDVYNRTLTVSINILEDRKKKFKNIKKHNNMEDFTLRYYDNVLRYMLGRCHEFAQTENDVNLIMKIIASDLHNHTISLYRSKDYVQDLIDALNDKDFKDDDLAIYYILSGAYALATDKSEMPVKFKEGIAKNDRINIYLILKQLGKKIRKSIEKGEYNIFFRLYIKSNPEIKYCYHINDKIDLKFALYAINFFAYIANSKRIRRYARIMTHR